MATERTLNGGLTSSTMIWMLIVVGMRKMMQIRRLETSIREYADKPDIDTRTLRKAHCC